MADKKDNAAKKEKEKAKGKAQKTKKELKGLEKELRNSAQDLKSKSEDRYNRAMNRLEMERDNMQNMMTEDYKEARRYVRSNPEEGLVVAFAGGLVLGLCLGILKR